MKSIRKVCISTICSALLSTSASAVIYEVRVNDSLNVRSEPSTSGRWVGSLYNGSRVDVTEVRGNWGRISNGWICLDFATPVSNLIQPRQYIVNVSDCLRFRSNPTTDSGIIENLRNGTVLTICEISNGWGKTTHNGHSGWVCMNYMKEYRVPAPAPTNQSVSLPVDRGSSIITQEYQGGQHEGIDIGSYGGRKINVYTVQEGTIREVVNNNQYNGGMGNYVVIDHSNGYSTTYMHLDSTCVNPGQKVSAGNKIGIMGTTGNSTGVHLHFRVQHNGLCVDPNSFIDLNVFRA